MEPHVSNNLESCCEDQGGHEKVCESSPDREGERRLLMRRCGADSGSVGITFIMAAAVSLSPDQVSVLCGGAWMANEVKVALVGSFCVGIGVGMFLKS